MSANESRIGLPDELRVHKVSRVPVGYAAAAFVILQVADLLSAGLSTTAPSFPTIALLAGLGLPVAVMLAWAYELAPDGVRRAEPVAVAELARAGWKRLAVAVSVSIVVFGAGGWWAASAPFAGDETARPLAVLPFERLSADEGDA